MNTCAFETVRATEAQQWLREGKAILIDVREPNEFATTHIPYALSIPLAQVSTLFPQLGIPVETKVLFQCQKGKRGEQACIAAEGCKTAHHIYNISGGIEGWKAAGLPTIGSQTAPKFSIFRQVQMIVGSLVALLVVAGFTGLTWAFAVAGILGAALALAGFTGWCGLAMLLSKMPWNNCGAGKSCALK